MASRSLAVPLKAFVYGNTAEPIPKTAGSAHTHAWKLYLRGARGEDLRPLVARVVFKLHESFAQPIRSAAAWAGRARRGCSPHPTPQRWTSPRMKSKSRAGASSRCGARRQPGPCSAH